MGCFVAQGVMGTQAHLFFLLEDISVYVGNDRRSTDSLIASRNIKISIVPMYPLPQFGPKELPFAGLEEAEKKYGSLPQKRHIFFSLIAKILLSTPTPSLG